MSKHAVLKQWHAILTKSNLLAFYPEAENIYFISKHETNPVSLLKIKASSLLLKQPEYYSTNM